MFVIIFFDINLDIVFYILLKFKSESLSSSYMFWSLSVILCYSVDVLETLLGNEFKETSFENKELRYLFNYESGEGGV
jgi:hypothetical protein